VLQREILVLEFIAVNAGFASSITIHEITSLNHEIFDHAVKRAFFVADGQIRFSVQNVNDQKYSALCDCDTYLNSPVQNWRKFSAVLGHTSAKSSIFTRPAGIPPIVTSKKTTGFSAPLILLEV
jgi:hypothetical protein